MTAKARVRVGLATTPRAMAEFRVAALAE